MHSNCSAALAAFPMVEMKNVRSKPSITGLFSSEKGKSEQVKAVAWYYRHGITFVFVCLLLFHYAPLT